MTLKNRSMVRSGKYDHVRVSTFAIVETYVMTSSKPLFLMFCLALLAKPEASMAYTCLAPALAANTEEATRAVSAR
jgi:hypothetical protein